MIFAKKKKILVWCDDPQEDPVISVFAGCLANHDRAHSRKESLPTSRGAHRKRFLEVQADIRDTW
jgi:hypothetical protein